MTPLSIFSINLLSENLLLLVSVLVFCAILVSRIGSKLGVPSLLLFLHGEEYLVEGITYQGGVKE